MAVGWAGDNAVHDQIRDSVNDEVLRARGALPRGPGSVFCEECGCQIPPARRKAMPGTRLCVDCQADADRDNQRTSLYNRRGSKDSQLR